MNTPNRRHFLLGTAALALFAAFMQQTNLKSIDISKAEVISALFVGGMLPFVFSALAMGAVGRAAMAMIREVRRQFADIPELKAALEAMKRNPGKKEEEFNDADRKIFDAAEGKAEHHIVGKGDWRARQAQGLLVT